MYSTEIENFQNSLLVMNTSRCSVGLNGLNTFEPVFKNIKSISLSLTFYHEPINRTPSRLEPQVGQI